MSAPESPAITEVQQLIQQQEELRKAVVAQTEAINGLGQNVQWIIDQTKGVFEMFSNPAFASMIPQMMGGSPDGE